jgi:hypothetical protein
VDGGLRHHGPRPQVDLLVCACPLNSDSPDFALLPQK